MTHLNSNTILYCPTSNENQLPFSSRRVRHSSRTQTINAIRKHTFKNPFLHHMRSRTTCNSVGHTTTPTKTSNRFASRVFIMPRAIRARHCQRATKRPRSVWLYHLSAPRRRTRAYWINVCFKWCVLQMPRLKSISHPISDGSRIHLREYRHCTHARPLD